MAKTKSLFQWRILLRIMGWLQIPMIGYVKPKLLYIDDECAQASIRLRRRTRNHLKSMYFGALAVGADVTAGLHVFYYCDRLELKPSFAFKSMKAEFLKRATGTVVFSSNEGKKVKELVLKALQTGDRVQWVIQVQATVEDETVAVFEMEVSVKIIG